MRKLVLLVVCLLMTIGAYAQSIVGQWVQTDRDAGDGMEMLLTETFTVLDGGAFEEEVIMEVRMTDAKSGKSAAVKESIKTFRLKITCKGGWSLVDGTLTQTFDAKSIRTEVLEQPDGFPKFIVNMLGKTVSSEFKKQAKKPERYKLVSVTSDELVLQSTDPDDPGNTTFTRKK